MARPTESKGGSPAAIAGKRVLKRGLQYLVSAISRPGWCLPGQSLLVLTYHRVLPAADPRMDTMQPGMVVTAEAFDLHLAALKEHFTLLHLSEWLRRARSGRPLPSASCAITFDDGWCDTYEVSYPLLQKYHVPATVFLVADFINTNRRFWPERLETVLAQSQPEHWSAPEFDWLKRLGASPAWASDHVIECAKELPDEAIHDHIALLEEMLAIPANAAEPDLMTWQQARSMNYSGLIEIGSHTRTHRRLGRPCGREALAREIVGSKDELTERLGRNVELFCYPNGESSPEAEHLVRRHYLAACSTVRGWNARDLDPHRVRRIGMHQGVSSDYHAFVSRLSGWL